MGEGWRQVRVACAPGRAVGVLSLMTHPSLLAPGWAVPHLGEVEEREVAEVELKN